jgi:hypothetical protein
MTRSAADLLDTIRRELAPGEAENKLVPLVGAGKADKAAIGALAAEQHRIIEADWRSFLTLAARSTEPASRDFFSGLAGGEGLAKAKLTPLAAACGFDAAAIRDYKPRPGCQAYPAYVSWLALHSDPATAVLTLVANFAAWGGYCATIAQGLREHYGFDDEACGFFDFFATPVPEIEEQALAAAQAGIDAGIDLSPAMEQGTLLQAYELMFWNTLAAV